jgi:hypothetical protein
VPPECWLLFDSNLLYVHGNLVKEKSMSPACNVPGSCCHPAPVSDINLSSSGHPLLSLAGPEQAMTPGAQRARRSMPWAFYSNWNVRLHVALGIAAGVLHMHKKGLLHRAFPPMQHSIAQHCASHSMQVAECRRMYTCSACSVCVLTWVLASAHHGRCAQHKQT